METKMEPLTPPHTPPTLDRPMHQQQQLQITSPRWIRSQQLSARFGQQHSTGQSYQAAFLDNWLRGAALLAVRGCCPQTTSPHSYHQQGHQGVHPALPVPPPASFLARRLPGQRPKKQFICKFLYSSTCISRSHSSNGFWPIDTLLVPPSCSPLNPNGASLCTSARPKRKDAAETLVARTALTMGHSSAIVSPAH